MRLRRWTRPDSTRNHARAKRLGNAFLSQWIGCIGLACFVQRRNDHVVSLASPERSPWPCTRNEANLLSTPVSTPTKAAPRSRNETVAHRLESLDKRRACLLEQTKWPPANKLLTQGCSGVSRLTIPTRLPLVRRAAVERTCEAGLQAGVLALVLVVA